MVDAAQIQYRDEFIAGFEQRQSLVRNTVTTEAVIKGNQATFLVADSGGATARTRGSNGLIPARNDSNAQLTATLQEWHDLVQKTGFNVFGSQGDQKRIMQMTTMAVINRKIDQDIIDQLETATQDTGSAATASLNMVTHAKTILGVNKAMSGNNVFGLITPAFEGYLSQVKEFGSADYSAVRPFDMNSTEDMPVTFRWNNVTWIVHPELPGVGTSAEKCFLYHRKAIGHAVDTAGIQAPIGYNEEQDYSWSRASAFMGSKLLQNAGVVIMNHDGSAYAAQ